MPCTRFLAPLNPVHPSPHTQLLSPSLPPSLHPPPLRQANWKLDPPLRQAFLPLTLSVHTFAPPPPRRQANWKLDPPLRQACRDDVGSFCSAEDSKGSEEGLVYKCMVRGGGEAM